MGSVCALQSWSESLSRGVSATPRVSASTGGWACHSGFHGSVPTLLGPNLAFLLPFLPGNWKAVSYRGDALFAPIASYEVAMLVRPLVRLSLRINTLLGLDRELSAEELEEMPETVVTEGLRWLRRKRFR